MQLYCVSIRQSQITFFMKTKICATCQEEHTVLYRVQIRKGKTWVFVCKTCCEKHQQLPEYRYGGTWKGSRH